PANGRYPNCPISDLSTADTGPAPARAWPYRRRGERVERREHIEAHEDCMATMYAGVDNTAGNRAPGGFHGCCPGTRRHPDTTRSTAGRFRQGHFLVWLNRLTWERGTASGQ